MMKKLSLVSLVLFLAACQTAPSAEPTKVEVHVTEVPLQTATMVPTTPPTSLPGSLTIPVDSFASEIPWLPLDENKRPTVVYIGVNSALAPFNNADVRKAFAAATDREAIATLAQRLYFDNVRPATNLTPSETIGRDLYEEIGIPFDPTQAKAYLEAAGYSDGSSFPPVLLIASQRGAAPGFYEQTAGLLSNMWSENLGVDVDVQIIADFSAYIDRLTNDTPQMWLLGWGADLNDPNDFLGTLFFSGNEGNFGSFLNEEFDSLITRALETMNPAERQLLYLEAERILTEIEAGVIPLFHSYFYRDS